MKRQAAAMALLLLIAGASVPVSAQGMTYGARRAFNMLRRKHRHHQRQQMNGNAGNAGRNSSSSNGNGNGSNFIQGSAPGLSN